ncbi:Threonine/homoserine efflux transporter RhtA [Andreprevotia lacus DSM 23236]|jgi:drug/metabolite transporter (DMT)-like permease|uniref:Threonine/homoserine efflux transporter RhtA n=1 Tax=Andreprevotia lacus DSM 23236 TaxID=1121001 RepID=A0A1W1WXG7_9NEIS|nr:EamA family transporter [Andreprevotia lacus]SMC16297.1 Threonine/homoserine efflux transporter RhtA [Andreprevotia lacus DSM 23236]
MHFNRYTLFLIASMALVGANVGLGKSIVLAVPVTLFALMRFVIGVGFLLPHYRWSRMRQVSRQQWLGLFLQALFGTFLFTLLMLNGVVHTSALAAGVITSTIPAVVIVLSWLLLKERLGRRAIAAVVLAVLGMLIINVSRAGSGGTGSLLGNAMVAGAVVCESIYVILSRRLTQNLAAIEICAYTHLLGLLLMLPLGLGAALQFDYGGLNTVQWLQIVWYGLAASVWSFWLWMKGIRHVPAQQAGVFTAALPVAAVAYAITFLNEQPTLAHGLALLCVLGAILLASGKPAETTSH